MLGHHNTDDVQNFAWEQKHYTGLLDKDNLVLQVTPNAGTLNTINRISRLWGKIGKR